MGKRVFLQALFLCLCLCANAIDYTRDDYYVRQYGSGSGDGSSWDDAMNCESFATALGMVKDGATFHIASGVYIPTCDKNYNKSAESQNKVFHTKKAVNLIGGYSWNPQNGEIPDPQNNKTVFSGDIKGNDYSSKADNSYNVISYELSRPSKILISGIEMKATQTAKDKNDGMLSVTSDINQNGIKIDVSVDKCVFHDGSSAFSFLGGDMDVLVSQCEIYNNANAWTNFYGNIRLESCAIYNNSIVKVDPYLYEREIVSKYSFVNCSFHKNKTISVETYIASVDLYNNTIVGDDISLLVRKADLNCVGNIIKASAINIDNLSNVAHNLFSNAVDKQVMATLSEKSNVFLEKAFSLLSDTLAYNGGFTKSFMLSGYSVGSEYLKFPLSKTVASKDQCGVDRCDITCMGSFEYKKKLVGMNYEISVGEQLDGQTYDKAGLYKVILNEMSGSECREKIGKLLVKPDVSVKKYYVKVNGSGSGDGSSWENALSGKAFIDYYQYADTEVTFYIAEGIYLPFSDKFTLVSGISYDRYVPERKKHVHIVGGFRKNITDEKEAPDPTKYHTVFHSDINDDDNVISEDESLEFSNRGDNVSSYFNIFFQEEGMSSFDGIHFVGNVNACLGFKCPKKVENVSVSISNCSFTNCDKLINLTGNVKLDFSNCRFSYVKDFPSCMNLTVNNCSFTHIVNGFTLTDGELKMTNSTFVDIKKTLLDCADSASAVLYNNTIIVPNKECVMDLPKKTSLEGNLLSFAKIGFSDGSYITSDHNIYSVSNEYMGKKDIVIPAISFSEFLSGDVSDGTFIPSVEHYNSLVDVVPLTKHVLANGYSLRFHRISFIDTDQRGVERIDSTCIGAYEFHCTDTVKVVKVDTSYLGKYYYGQQLLKLGMNSVEYDSVNALGCKRTVFHKVYVLPCDDSLYVDGVDTTYLGKIYYGQEMQRLGMNTVEIDTVNERECKRTVFHKVYVLPCDDSLYVDGVDTTYLGKIYYGQEMQRLGMNTVEIDTVNERECKRIVFHKVYVLPCDDSLYVDGVDTTYLGKSYYGHEMQRLGMNTVEVEAVNERECKRTVFHKVYVLPCDDSLYVDGVDTTYLGKFYYGQEMQRLGMNTVEIDTVNERECKRTVFHKVYVLPCDDSLYVDGVDTVYVGSIYYGHEMQRLGMNTVEIDTVNERECKRTVFHKVYVLPCDDSLYVDGVDTTYLGKIYYGQEMQRLGMNTVEIDTVNERECKRTVFHKVYVLQCTDSVYVDGVDTVYVGSIYYGHEMQRLGMNTVEIEAVNERECKRTIFHKVYVLQCADSVYVDGVDTVYVGSIYYGQEMQRLGMNTVEIDTVNEMGCKRSIFHDVMVLVCDDSIYAEEIDYIHVGEMYYGQNMYLPGLNTVEEEIVNDHGCRKTIFHRVMVLEKEESVEPKDTIDKKDPIVEPVIPEIPETPIVEEEGNKEENEEGEGNKEEDEEGDDVPEIKIPTAFSPYQKDGKNDIFMKGYEVYIYDRYSNLVFHSTNGWDGRSGAKLVNAGVYVYAVKLQTGEIRRGTIEVLKRK